MPVTLSSSPQASLAASSQDGATADQLAPKPGPGGVDNFDRQQFRSQLDQVLKNRIQKEGATPAPKVIQSIDIPVGKMSEKQIDDLAKASGLDAQKLQSDVKAGQSLHFNLSEGDLKLVSQATPGEIMQSYYEGAAAVRGSCVLAQAQRASNAQKILGQYADYVKDHNFLSWGYRGTKKDLKAQYQKATGAVLKQDLPVFEQAKRFCEQMAQLSNGKSNVEKMQMLNTIVKQDKDAAMAWVALRRIVLKKEGAI